jgi:predicted signal transduction protein with EAL and GGDEF domain
MDIDTMNIKTDFIGLKKNIVDDYIIKMTKGFKNSLNDLQKQIKFLERTKIKLLAELEEAKSQNQKIVYENEVLDEIPFNQFIDDANKRVSKTIALINEIADQKIDNMVEKATVRLTEYDNKLEMLQNEIEENREKIENLLTEIMNLLKNNINEFPNKTKDNKAYNNTDENSLVDTAQKEDKPYYFNIKKRESKDPTLISKEVENTVINSLQKYNESKDEFVKKLEDILISIDFREPNGAVLILQINEFIMANYFLDCSTGNILTDIIIDYLKSISKNIYVQRLSYDQIGIIYNGISDVYRISQFAKNILDYIEKDIFVENKKIDLSANIGISIYSKSTNSVDVLMNYAGIALYKAKEEGKGHYQFIDDEFINKVKFVNDLKTALTKSIKNDELDLHYQPQYSLENNELIGFEALLRWQNDKYNKTSVFEVIKIAEKENIINDIGLYLFKKACYFAKEVENKSDKRLIVSVNFSAMQIIKDGFVNSVKKIINETDVSPYYLGFEITESCFIDNFSETSYKLQQLKDMGITISIDDFGTGYSTLSYLLKLPVSLIKIDKSFLDDLTISPKTEIFINSIINITHNLGLKVVAEGIETETQYEILKKLKCDYVQGFLLARPVPENEAFGYI